MEEVKEHPYVIQCDAAKPLIVDTFKFLYDLDFLESQADEVIVLFFLSVLAPTYTSPLTCLSKRSLLRRP